jgi:DNA-binding transcriptional LysR family regulator
MMEDYADAVAEARGQARQLTGLLRVNGPVGLGELRLNGLVLDFLADYPEIEIELILNDRMIDLVEEGVDVAIRLGGDLPPNVIARPVAEAPRLLVAAPSYMKGRAALLRPEELADHDYIRFAGLAVGDRMEFFRAGETVAVPVGGRYRVNSSLALRQCFLDGVGLGTAPAWLVQDLIESGALFRLLPDWTMASQPLHLVYPSRKYQPARTKAFLRFMMERLPKLPGFQT